jgi:hypothetical protein
MLDAALAIAARGWPVFPCQPRAKQPLCKHGFKDATDNVGTIREWWTAMPDANIGGPTGAYFDVLDVDDLDCGADLFGGEDVELPPGPASFTPSGGVHLYFAPTGLGNRAKFVPGCDWRGVGGYVMFPPSVGANGQLYGWWPDPDCWHDEVVPVPGWLRLLLERNAPAPARTPTPLVHPFARFRRVAGSNYGAAALKDERATVASAQEGCRNDTLVRAAFSLGQLVAAGSLDGDEVAAALLDAATGAGLPEGEARRTIASGLAAGLNQPRRD